MRKALFKLLCLLQLPRLCRYLNRRRVLILTYHGFTDRARFDGIQNHQGMHLNVGSFRRHVKHLKRHYSIVPLEQVVAHFRNGTELPEYSAVITIDDGYRSTHSLAYPVLKEFNAPASVFIATDFVCQKIPLWPDRVEYAINNAGASAVRLRIDSSELELALESTQEKLSSARTLLAALKSGPQEQVGSAVEKLEQECGSRLLLEGRPPELYTPLEWEEVAQMTNDGLVSIGSHTQAHLILSRCAGDVLREELHGSREVIERQTGLECQMFCYPNGAAGDFNDRTKAQLKAAGYSCGLTTVPGMNSQGSDVMELKRLSAPKDFAEFVVATSGLKLLLSQVRGRLRRLLPVDQTTQKSAEECKC